MFLRFRYNVLRLLIDFIIPAVIHSDFACLNLFLLQLKRSQLYDNLYWGLKLNLH